MLQHSSSCPCEGIPAEFKQQTSNSTETGASTCHAADGLCRSNYYYWAAPAALNASPTSPWASLVGSQFGALLREASPWGCLQVWGQASALQAQAHAAQGPSSQRSINLLLVMH